MRRYYLIDGEGEGRQNKSEGREIDVGQAQAGLRLGLVWLFTLLSDSLAPEPAAQLNMFLRYIAAPR